MHTSRDITPVVGNSRHLAPWGRGTAKRVWQLVCTARQAPAIAAAHSTAEGAEGHCIDSRSGLGHLRNHSAHCTERVACRQGLVDKPERIALVVVAADSMLDVGGSSLGALWCTADCTSTVAVETKRIAGWAGNAAEGTGWVAAEILEAKVAVGTDGVDVVVVAAAAAAVVVVAAVAENALAAGAESLAERIRSAGIAVVVLETPKKGWASPGLKNGPREGPDRLVASVRSHRRDLASRGRTLTVETLHRMDDGRACRGRWVWELPEVWTAAIFLDVETGMTANRILPMMQGPGQQLGEVRGVLAFLDLWQLVATSLYVTAVADCPAESWKALLSEGLSDCRSCPGRLLEGPSAAQAVRDGVAVLLVQWQRAQALGSWPACHMDLAKT